MKEIQNVDVVGYFDGASRSMCSSVVLIINNSHSFNFQLQCGTGSNMKTELLALRCLCKVASNFGIVTLWVYEDSRVTIKWVQGAFNLKVVSLLPWCRGYVLILRILIISFYNIFIRN